MAKTPAQRVTSQQPTPPSRRIVIADHSAAVREALRWLLDNERDFDVVGEATNSAETVTRAIELAPDLVIVDIDLPNVGGYTIARMLKQLPDPPLVILLAIINTSADHLANMSEAQPYYDGIIWQGADWPASITQIRTLLANPGTSKQIQTGQNQSIGKE